jgi:hypothetical protein
MTTGVQLRLVGLPIDPEATAKLSAPERDALYRQLGLHAVQIAAAEEAVRLALAHQYGRRGR